MTDQPALVAREARSIHAGLKTLLSGDVWANYREADFERKNLRRRYLHLLLLHPNARESRDAGTYLWMQTSYAFIALYKQRLNSNSRPQNNHNNNNQRHNNSNNPVETRKLLQRFRQFLADEDRFWRALVLRVQRAYEIGPFAPHVNLPPELVVGSGAAAEEEEHGHGATEDRMNHFGFPSAAAVSSAAETMMSVDDKTACSVLSKALVCLGDIARYREQYKMPPGKNPNAKKQQQVYIEPRPNYSRAKALYTAAHALAPEEGNAAHQLAILAGYESDPLASLFWYLRALCVAAPFDTAGENLAGMLAKAKAVDARVHGRGNGGGEGGGARQNGNGNAKNGNGNGNEGEGTDEEQEEREPPRVRVERFRREVVLLHALWREGSTPALTRATPLASHLARAFARMVARRMLPEEMIVRVLMVAQGAVWVGRMVVVPPMPVTGEEDYSGKEKEKEAGKGGGGRNSGNRRNRTGTVTPAMPVKSAEIEAKETKEREREEKRVQRAHLIHVFELYDALLGVGVRELGEVDMYTTGGGGGGVVGATGALGETGRGERGGGGARGGGRGRRGRGGGGGAARGAAAGGGGVVSADAAIVGAGAGIVGAHGGGEEGVGLAERISAEFRRTLPALRVASRWVRANWAWAVPPSTSVATSALGAGGRQSQSAGEGEEAWGERERDGDDALEEARRRFWTTYAEFLRRLARTFPVGMLPKLSEAPLEGSGEGEAQGQGQGGEEELELELDEDLDMLGWLPLLGSASVNGGDGGEKNLKTKTAEPRKVTVGLREGVHPNVEQLMRIADLLRDARRLVGLPNSPLAMYGGVFVVKGVEAIVPAGPQNRLYQPQLGIQQQTAQDDEYDDDAQTEKTSRTDDDLLHDAFAFLDQSDAGVSSVSEDGDDDDDEDDDKIVWDLRDRVEASPRIPTTARTSPKTPVKPTPIGIGRPQPATATTTSVSPLRPPPLGMGLGLSLGGIGIGIPSPHHQQQQQHAPMRSPQQQQQEPITITTGSQVPATTALDLLNTFSKKPVPAAPQPGGNDGLLFGSGAQQQSIWAAARDETGLMFGAGGGAGQQQQQHVLGQQVVVGGGLGGYAGAEQRQHALGHHRFASQDPVGQQTIWASSYPTPQIPGSAPNMGGGFGHGHGHGLSPSTHQRGLSSSMVAAQQQLFLPRGGESYRYGPATPTSAPQYASGGGSTGEMNVFYATSGQGFVPSPQQQQPIGSSLGVGHSPGHVQSAGLAPQGGFGQHTHARHLSLDPRAAASFHTHGGVQQPISPLSQLWGNVGG
ncbi:hypothetical protein R3P38DRAFT_3258482 [Favolaschia claudopus]|uniref:Uncharacterized protein n=1 Tax=Favolaschia claudopus TaxID=2862362 RepID=A0AAW0CY23_9AGAR